MLTTVTPEVWVQFELPKWVFRLEMEHVNFHRQVCLPHFVVMMTSVTSAGVEYNLTHLSSVHLQQQVRAAGELAPNSVALDVDIVDDFRSHGRLDIRFFSTRLFLELWHRLLVPQRRHLDLGTGGAIQVHRCPCGWDEGSLPSAPPPSLLPFTGRALR